MRSVRAARQIVRSMARRVLVARALILIYHRVTPLDFDPERLAVHPDRFNEQMDVLRRHYRVLSVSELNERILSGSVPRRAVAVTFDDGYADNLLKARPILERHEVSATCFVTTGQLDQGSEFWWDELAGLLLETPHLPETLSVDVNGERRSWSLRGDADASRSPVDQDGRNWNVLSGTPATPRQKAYRELAALVRTLDADARESIMQQLADCAGTKRMVREKHRPLHPEEVVKLDAGGLVEVGAHTVTHPMLSAQPRDAQDREIRLSKRRLEEILNRKVGLFAYPFGERADYTSETVALVREAGFACACSNFEGWVRRGTNTYELPRYMVRDWDGETFARELAGWYAN